MNRFLIAGVLVCVVMVVWWGARKEHGAPLTSSCVGQTIELTVHILPNSTAVQAAGKAHGIDLERGRLLGFATKVTGTNRHALYVTEPRGQRDRAGIETWGHELMHAICGAWHP